MAEYDSILRFTQKILDNFGIYSFQADSLALSQLSLDCHLREYLFLGYDHGETCRQFEEQCREQTLHFMEDSFCCRYTTLKLPDTDPPVYFHAGPYILRPADLPFILSIQQKLTIPPEQMPFLRSYYRNVPFIEFEDTLRSIFLLLAKEIYGGTDTFSINYRKGFMDHFIPTEYVPAGEKYDRQELLERQYAHENDLMAAIASGNYKKVELFLSRSNNMQMEQRATNLLRDQKNYLIIYNTILRKAAENGGVHPLYLDDLSSQFAHKIEQVTSEVGRHALMRDMPRKYCLLVRSYSTKGYSPIIQKVLNYISMHFEDNLGLKELSVQFSVNPAYLSSLFKKELGCTLTGYINRKRVEQALLLLNTTDLYIQTIAASCGIPDLNYFTKIFKKQTGMTPRDYRAMLHK